MTCDCMRHIEMCSTSEMVLGMMIVAASTGVCAVIMYAGIFITDRFLERVFKRKP